MKKNYGVFFGFAVLLITTIFTLAACGDTGDLTSPPENIPAKVATPTANPVAGEVSLNTPITLSTTTEGAAIYYTTDGSTPTTASTVYSDDSKPTVTANPTTIKAIACKDGMTDSDILTAVYTSATIVVTPTASPPAGEVALDTAITLSTTTEGAAIRYTTDGSDPTSGSTLYSDGSKPKVTANPTTIKAIAYKDGMTNSAILTVVYTIEPVATPTANPAAGEVAFGTEITLSTTTEGAEIYYTTDGTDPTSSSTAYSDGNKPEVTANPTTIKAIAVKSGIPDSAIFTAGYTLDHIPIGSLQELMAINDNAANLSKDYILTANISGVTTPIGSVLENMVPFTGEFDGNGHTITVNIGSGAAFSVGEFAGIYSGLFAGIGTGGSVHDLTVAGTVTITNSANQIVGAGGVAGGMFTGASINNVESSVVVTVTSSGNGDVFAGGIVGGLQGGTVSNSHATGIISASGSGHPIAGGVVGVSQQGTVSNASATGNVSAITSADEGAQAGGVVGVSHQGTVSNVYATGDISATSNGGSMGVGGIVGACQGGTVSYAYATGSVSATAQGTGPGESNNSVTVCASGIVGGSNPGPVIQYTVALNSAISATGNNYKRPSYRIISTPGGIVTTNDAANYGKVGLVLTGGNTGSVPANDTSQNGADVTASDASTQTWWTEIGFNGADWTNVWEWDDTSGLPKLR
jgi:predicted small lipoprotein YifL